MYGGALLIGIAHSSGPLSLGQVRWEALQAEANSRLRRLRLGAFLSAKRLLQPEWRQFLCRPGAEKVCATTPGFTVLDAKPVPAGSNPRASAFARAFDVEVP